MPGHELSGIVVELGYGTTGLTVGQRVFGLGDWARNGSLAEYTAVEARNLSALRADIDHTVAAALPVVLGLGADAFLDPASDRLEDAGEVDVVLDGLGGEIGERSAALVRAGGTLVTIAAPPQSRPRDGRAVFFVVEADRGRLADLAQRVREGRLKPIVGDVRTLADAPLAFAPDRRTQGKTIIRVIDGG